MQDANVFIGHWVPFGGNKSMRFWEHHEHLRKCEHWSILREPLARTWSAMQFTMDLDHELEAMKPTGGWPYAAPKNSVEENLKVKLGQILQGCRIGDKQCPFTRLRPGLTEQNAQCRW